MSLLKEEYQALLSLVQRAAVTGINEAKTIVILEQKLQARIANWFDGHVTGLKEVADTADALRASRAAIAIVAAEREDLQDSHDKLLSQANKSLNAAWNDTAIKQIEAREEELI